MSDRRSFLKEVPAEAPKDTTVKDPRTFAVMSILLNALVLVSTYAAQVAGALGPRGAFYVAVGLPIVNMLIQVIKQKFPGIAEREARQ